MSELADAIGTPTPTPAPAPTPTPTPTPAPEPSVQRPTWLDALPDDLRNNPETAERLARYGDVGSLAKGLLETEKWARGRVALPREGDAASFEEFASRMRPATADDYKLDVPEGDPGEMAQAFKPVFHRLGLHPQQAAELAKAWNGFQEDLTSRMAQQGRDEIKALELEQGPVAYNRRVEAVSNMVGQMQGLDAGKAMDALEQAMGARPAMELLFQLAERTGELEKVDGAAVAMRMGSLSPEGAQATIDQKMNERDYMAKAARPGTPEHREWQELNRAASAPKR